MLINKNKTETAAAIDILEKSHFLVYCVLSEQEKEIIKKCQAKIELSIQEKYSLQQAYNREKTKSGLQQYAARPLSKKKIAKNIIKARLKEEITARIYAEQKISLQDDLIAGFERNINEESKEAKEAKENLQEVSEQVLQEQVLQELFLIKLNKLKARQLNNFSADRQLLIQEWSRRRGIPYIAPVNILTPRKLTKKSKKAKTRTKAQEKEEFAKMLLRRMTRAEKIILPELDALGFLPQKVVFGFIPDFWLPSKKVIVEIDGGYHSSPEQIEKDKKRDEVFFSKGFKVLHFTNNQVSNDLKTVVEQIKKVVSV